MKTHLSSGLIIFLPALLTVLLINFLVNFITHPFLEPTQNLLENWTLFNKPMFSFQQTTWVAFLSKGLILVSIVGFILLTGVLAQLFVADLLFRTSDKLLHRLPLINKVYKISQDTVYSLFSSSSKKFTQVVLIPFPNANGLSLGLLADNSVSISGELDPTWGKIASVFVPGTPNPSVGFTLLFKVEQLIFIDMSVEDAMKFLLSVGMVMPDFKIKDPNHQSLQD